MQGICLPPPLWAEIIRRTRAKFFLGPHLKFKYPASRGPFDLPDILGRSKGYLVAEGKF